MRRTWRGSAVLMAAFIAIPLAACTSGPAGTASTQPSRLPYASPPAGETLLPCADEIDTAAQPTLFKVVLGVVSLPASPGYPALQTSLSGHTSGPLRLFAKTGLVIKPGTRFELIIPAPFTRRVRIGWGMPGTPSRAVLVSNCTNPGGTGWLAYAGGYWIDHPACVPIIVRAGGRQQEVHIGLGTACPGQSPPQGPTQS